MLLENIKKDTVFLINFEFYCPYFTRFFIREIEPLFLKPRDPKLYQDYPITQLRDFLCNNRGRLVGVAKSRQKKAEKKEGQKLCH